MKYVDNLLAWGDQLFRRDTIEAIGEATQLYVLAAEILGRAPEQIARDRKSSAKTFNTLTDIGALGNALASVTAETVAQGGSRGRHGRLARFRAA